MKLLILILIIAFQHDWTRIKDLTTGSKESPRSTRWFKRDLRSLSPPRLGKSQRTWTSIKGKTQNHSLTKFWNPFFYDSLFRQKSHSFVDIQNMLEDCEDLKPNEVIVFSQFDSIDKHDMTKCRILKKPILINSIVLIFSKKSFYLQSRRSESRNHLLLDILLWQR